MKGLTVNQRSALETIRVVQKLQVERLAKTIAENASDPAFKNAVPSRWVLEYTLTEVHHLPWRQIRALEKKGFLERRPTDGFGYEVKPKNEEGGI